MQTPNRYTNLTIFALFFGIALLEAVGSGRWLAAAFWLAVGLLFLRADQVAGNRHHESGRP